MKWKKILVFVIITILIILIFIQNNLKKNNKGNSNIINYAESNKNIIDNNNNDVGNSNNINIYVNKDEKKMFVTGQEAIYKQYELSVSNEEFSKKVYELAMETLPQIQQNVSENMDENLNYYYNNKDDYYSKGILNKEDFILIANDVYNLGKNNDVAFYSASLDLDNVTTENGYVEFVLNFKYSNNQVIMFKCYLANSSELEPQIKFSSNSAIQQLYDVVGENSFGRIEAIKTINNFLSNAKTLEDNTVRKTYNQISEYYSQNTSYINSLGIYSSDDLININKNLNKINWNNSVSFSLYSIDTDTSLTQDDYYVNAKLLVPYDTNNNLEITISVAKASNIKPQIKIS